MDPHRGTRGRAYKGQKHKRDAGPFIALPHVVLESKAFRGLSYPARCLLIDISIQVMGRNNGKLVACAKYLAPLGWTSNDVVVRARRQLLDAGLLVETRKGARPNNAAWYALPWLDLDVVGGLDIDPSKYRRGNYRDSPALKFVAPVGGRE